MNEEEQWIHRAQVAFDAMEQGERETFEEEMRSVWEASAQKIGLGPEDLEGEATEQLVREMCIIHLARTMVRVGADLDAWAAELVTEELFERYVEEEFERLVKLPEYAQEKKVPSDVLLEAMQARLISEHPEASKHPSAPKEQH
jgi:hypothetical protein